MTNKKTKARNAEKAKSHRALKEQRRVAARKPEPVVGKKIRARILREKMDRELPADKYVRWLAHGVNYMLSDYEQGRWEPLFDDIYEGFPAPSPEDIALTVMQRFGEPMVGTFQEKLQRACIAWTVADMQNHYIYVLEAKRRLKETDPETDLDEALFAPHNPVTWRLLHEIRAELLART